jgi:hypothetical protein
MKKIQPKEQEKGQIIILLAVSMVVVMVVAALAVDGGMIYTERRFAQNAADASGFAGGGVILNSNMLEDELTCPSTSSYKSNTDTFTDADNLVAMIVNAARSRATANNINDLPYLGYKMNDTYKDDYGINDNQGIIVECNDESDPKIINVIVRVTSQVSTAFAHLIYPGPLQTTNEAVVSIEQAGKAMNGDAIIALSTQCNTNGNQNKNIGGLLLNSNGLDITVVNGGAFSNSCLYVKNQSNSSLSVTFNIVGDIVGTDPDQSIITNNTNKNQTPLPTNFPNPPKPDCSTADEGETTTETIGSDTVTYYWPGYYDSGIKISNGSVIFKPGLYCIDGEFNFSGGDVSGGNVTFYLSDSASIKNNGNSDLKFVAPTNPTNPYFGLLFYIDGGGDITWNGTNDSHYNGLVYAPKRNFQISGNSNNQSGTCPQIPELPNICNGIKYPTQMIGYQFVFTGSSTINITNPKDSLYSISSELFLQK